jgi:long-subunit acyl-CoA synthetase (AMP-forming)
MKLMGIFSENRLEWFISELACCSDSIAIVPVPVSFASE